MATPVTNPEIIEAAQTAVKGLTVMTAIPVAALALWADYFERNVERLKNDKEERDIDDELRMVRLAFLVGLFYQLLLYVSTFDVRDHYPIYSNVLFVAALLAQMRIQSRLEFKVLPTPKVKTAELRPAKPQDGANLKDAALRGKVTASGAGRAFLFSLMSGIGYLVVLLGTLRLFTWFAIATHASPIAGAAWIIAGAILGILGGLSLAFALGPIQLKSMYATSPLTDPETRARIEACFRRASIPTPTLWLIRGEDGFQPPANAMIAGIPGMRGALGPALFVSDRLLATLNWDEFEAVMMHEISHVRLRHLRRRFTFAAGLILGGILLSTMLIVAVALISRNVPMAIYAGTILVFGGFIYALKQMGAQSRFQEIEADLEALRLGASPEALVQALRKLDRLNGIPNDHKGTSHPATEERILLLRKAFTSNLASAMKDADAQAEAGKAVTQGDSTSTSTSTDKDDGQNAA